MTLKLSLRRFRRETQGPFAPLALQHPGIVMADHPGAGTRGRHPVIGAFILLYQLLSQRHRRLVITGIVSGLAAAGLAQGNGHFTAGLLQQFDTGKGDGGSKQVREAGDEQRDPQGLWRARLICWGGSHATVVPGGRRWLAGLLHHSISNTGKPCRPVQPCVAG